MRTRQRGIVVAALVLMTAATVWAEGTKVLEAILVRVNDRIITVSEFRQRLEQELSQMADPPTGADLVAFKKQLLQTVTNEMILLERAEEKNIAPDDAAVDEAISGLRKDNNLEDDAAFKEALKQSGLTEEGLRDRYRKSFMIQRAAQGEIKPREITAEELKAIYERDKQKYAVPAKVELQQMIFPVASDGSDLDAVLTRVRGMLKRVRAGADLEAEATLAGIEVQDLGAIPVQDLRPELVDLLAPLGDGDFTEPAVASGAVQVLRLVRRIPAGYQPFDEVKDELRRAELERTFYEERQGFIDKLKKEYLVEVHADRLSLVDGGADE